MRNQLGLFEEAGVALEKPDESVEITLGKHSVRYPLKKKRREACQRLMEILVELEGKDIHIGSYDAGGQHYWLDNLKLPRLQIEYHPIRYKDDFMYIPSVIVLWGSRSASIRIFTDYLVAVREQEYQGYWLYLLDFRNGFYDNKLDQYRSHYACLHITRFKD